MNKQIKLSFLGFTRQFVGKMEKPTATVGRSNVMMWRNNVTGNVLAKAKLIVEFQGKKELS